ncbi:murein transglycosylase [Bdellovibrio sp. qaytius]|nr:murein transglycosylase [Bdellovibrio sp. qaytius]
MSWPLGLVCRLYLYSNMKTQVVKTLFAFGLTILTAGVVKASLQTPQLHPTIYFIKSIDMDQQDCAMKKAIHSETGKAVLKVCANDYKTCAIEGTCAIKHDGEVTIINYVEQRNGIDLFKAVDKETCPYGLGVKNICLDPYYTVAADLTYHDPGDVIFVEEMKGTKLPNGEVHDGFFIVRDKGGAIKGANRFDFYTGLVHYKNDENPFTPLGFANENASFAYRNATSAETLAVRKSRNYPGLPGL